MAKAKTTNATKDNSIGFKTFKSSSEIENLYRFIHENNLRAEAKTLIELVVKRLSPPKKKRGRKKLVQ